MRLHEIGDALSLTPTHVNRKFQKRQGLGWITLGTDRLIVHGWDALKQAGDFDPTYLQLGSRVIS